jgi:hypothetical protein
MRATVQRVFSTSPVRRGIATSSTDTGHVGGNARFALGHPEKIVARQAPKQSTARYQKMNKELLP